MTQKQSEAQKEAKRLYKLFYKAQDAEYIHNDDMKRLARESAIISAKETTKRAVRCSFIPDTTKAFYRDVIRELKKL